jgi:hypothetical protein
MWQLTQRAPVLCAGWREWLAFCASLANASWQFVHSASPPSDGRSWPRGSP